MTREVLGDLRPTPRYRRAQAIPGFISRQQCECLLHWFGRDFNQSKRFVYFVANLYNLSINCLFSSSVNVRLENQSFGLLVFNYMICYDYASY